MPIVFVVYPGSEKLDLGPKRAVAGTCDGTDKTIALALGGVYGHDNSKRMVTCPMCGGSGVIETYQYY